MPKLRIVSTRDEPDQPAAERPAPEESHRLVEAFWQIRDSKVRRELIRAAEAAAG